MTPIPVNVIFRRALRSTLEIRCREKVDHWRDDQAEVSEARRPVRSASFDRNGRGMLSASDLPLDAAV